jgi:predicted amidophosphoribosyltransferase
MRRERRDLVQRREVGIRDLGGLLLEMVRRDRFRPELLLERADRVIAVEHRINELDSLLVSSAAAGRHLRRVPRCACGAPLPPGVHFCSHCGRPARTTPPVAACEHCGQPLPAEANFCASCGNAVASDAFGRAGGDDTMVAPPPAPLHEERG